MSVHTTSNPNLSKITSNNLFSVLNTVIQNKNKCSKCSATEICFELFQRCFSSYFKNKTQAEFSIEQLKIYIKQLISENKFSRDIFSELLLNELNDVPLKLIAWLDENNIYFFEQYCMNNSVANISTQIINLIETNAKHEISYIFIKLLISVYNIGITNSSKLFTIKCRKVLEDFLKVALNEFDNEPKLLNILPIIGELNLIYEQTIQQFTKQILQKLLTNNEHITLQDAFLMQEIWTLKNISEEFIGIFYELIKMFKTEDLFELFTSISDRNLNWKFALILISVYVKKNPDGYKQIKDIIFRKMQVLFNDQSKNVPSNELLKYIILIRQICYEQENPQLSYSEWYSNTFGPNTILRTGSDSNAFHLLVATLTSVVSKEPIHVLKTHIERSIRTPSGCQSDMLVFKDVCRVQLSRIIQSEQINIKNSKIPALLILEDALNRLDNVWTLNQPDICKSLLPFIISDSKYDRLKEMITKSGKITHNDLAECRKVNVVTNDVIDVEEMLFE